MLAGLRHRAVSGRADQDRAVHLGGTGDHVLDVVGVTRAVNVGVVAGFRFVFDVRGRNRDATGLFFRSLVDRVIGVEFAAEALGADLGQRSSQGGLAVIDVTDGADVHVRLGAFKLALGHVCIPLMIQ